MGEDVERRGQRGRASRVSVESLNISGCYRITVITWVLSTRDARAQRALYIETCHCPLTSVVLRVGRVSVATRQLVQVQLGKPQVAR
jgi:hypothetical protein